MKRILIIEDDAVVANIYRNRFQMAGFQVEVAADGETGLQRAREFRPHLVQLDLSLPKLSGVEVIKAIRNDPKLKATPVFVLTNGYLTDLVKQAWEAGADKCLTKAECTPKVMHELVAKQLTPPQPAPGPAPPRPRGGGSTAISTMPPLPAEAPGEDALFEGELRAAFREGGPREVNALRALHHGVVKAAKGEAVIGAIGDLRRKVRSLASNAGVVGYRRLSRLASALEILLKDLYEHPENINPSTHRTVAQAIDCIARAFDRLGAPDPPAEPEAKILVVDDDLISRKALAFALQKAGLKCLSVGDPFTGLNLLSENRFDLVFLDVDMPGMTGFDLCQKLRALPMHKETPVVFVTTLNDFENRAKSTLSGGTDLIGKPFPFLELGVKALIHLQNSGHVEFSSP